jgi:hypothetical protein
MRSRLERAEEALADAVHHWDKWCRGWGKSPSYIRREHDRIERAARKVRKRGGDPYEVAREHTLYPERLPLDNPRKPC